jgi:hypothetical protein
MHIAKHEIPVKIDAPGAIARQAPHWGYMLSGEVVVTYTDGSEEGCATDELFYWPPGHSVRVVNDAEVILFSPQVLHAQVMDHMVSQMGA